MSKQTTEKKSARGKAPSKKGAREIERITVDGKDRSWQSMAVLSNHWHSDLKFFNDELNFFRKLIDKYLMWLMEEANIDSTRKLASDLKAFDQLRSDLDHKV